MVVATARLRAPVVSLLTPNPAASRVAQRLLSDLFSIQPIATNVCNHDDELDQLLNFPIMRRAFDSAASKCSATGTLLHFLSLTTTTPSDDDSSDYKASNNGHISLIGITDCNSQNDTDAVEEARRMLASHVSHDNNRLASRIGLVLNHALGRQLSASDVTGINGGLPLLELPQSSNDESREHQFKRNSVGGLKEIAVPFVDDSSYPNGQSLLSVLGSSSLSRPAVGLYQWPENGLVVRPLPSAAEDRTLPAPSLVFYTDNLEEAAERVSKVGALSAKIGFNGLQNSGQLMVSHSALLGLDIRVTDNCEFTSAFPEAQEALLASSLGELQNVNVFVNGGKDDSRSNNTDCWVEFRANMKKPSGFIKRSPKGTTKRKIAKAPDLPFE